MRGHREVKDPPSLMREDQKYIQDLKSDRRHGKEVDRYHAFCMIVEEDLPCLQRRPAPAHHVFAHAGFANVDAQLEQLTMDLWSTPERIVAAHRA